MRWARVNSKPGLEPYKPLAGAIAGKPYSPLYLGVLANLEQLEVKSMREAEADTINGGGLISSPPAFHITFLVSVLSACVSLLCGI